LLAGLLIPELLYDVYLDIVYVKGIFDITFARNARWGHVPHAAPPAKVTEGCPPRKKAWVAS
jgi:hypothetical protein